MSRRSMVSRIARRPLLFVWLLLSLTSLAAGCRDGGVVRFRVLFSGDLRSYVEPCT